MQLRNSDVYFLKAFAVRVSHKIVHFYVQKINKISTDLLMKLFVIWI